MFLSVGALRVEYEYENKEQLVSRKKAAVSDYKASPPGDSIAAAVLTHFEGSEGVVRGYMIKLSRTISHKQHHFSEEGCGKESNPEHALLSLYKISILFYFHSCFDKHRGKNVDL